MKLLFLGFHECCLPWKSKDYFLNGFSVKTIVLVGIYNQQFKGTILFMVFDFQGLFIVILYFSQWEQIHLGKIV